MNAKRLALILLIIIAAVTMGCGGEKAYKITTLPAVGSDGSIISPEEREMIRALLPFFVALSEKDIGKMKAIFPAMSDTSDDQVANMLTQVKGYILHGLEDVSYNNGKLRARMIYSAELNKPGTIGRNMAPMKTDVVMVRKNNTWVIAEWKQIKDEGKKDMEYFRDVFARQKNAEKRYGVKDLANWINL